MTLHILGINHRTAPVEIREKVAFAPEQMVAALGQAQAHTGVEEIAILSTCNRTELYVSSGTTGTEQLMQWLSDYHRLPGATLASSCYHYTEALAVAHMMKVASGLDSMVLGEPQILGQIKSAYAVAQQAGTVSVALNQVFQHVFNAAKRVRSETAIGQNPVSVAYAAVRLAQQIFSDMGTVHALLIGAGETVELLARHLGEQGVGSITVANRTLRHAQELANAYGAEAILLSDIPEHLHRADIVISSTASQLPVLGKGAVESALKQRRHRPMFMLDIAVPRDIEPEVANLDDVYLYTVDDLKTAVEENLRGRQDAADRAQEIIKECLQAWQKNWRLQAAVGTIRAFRNSVEELRDAELDKALQALAQGQSVEAVVRSLAHGLTNKLLHTPTLGLKRAGEEGRSEQLQLARELFNLPELDDDGGIS